MRTSFEEFQSQNLDKKKQATKNLYYVRNEIPTHQQIKAIVNKFSLHWLNVKFDKNNQNKPSDTVQTFLF